MRRARMALSSVGLFLLFASASAGAGAAQVGDVQRQLADSRLRMEELRAERDRLQTELASARGGLRDVSRELSNIERQLSASRSMLAELDLQLEIASRDAAENSRALLVTRDRHLEAAAVLQRRLREVYKLGPLHTTRVLVGAESFTDLLNRYRYLKMIAAYDRALVQRVGQLEEDLRARDREHRSNMNELERLRRLQLAEVGELRVVESERQVALNRYLGEEVRALSRLEALELDSERMRGLIDDLEDRRVEVERPGPDPARPADAVTLPPTEGGTLDWPVAGEILYRFGPQQRPGGAVVRWNGLGIAAPRGAPVQAVRAGTVVHAGPFEGYGPSVIVSHGEGLYTLYLYLEEVGVVEGRRVEPGQMVGTVGGGAASERPYIEFQIRNPQAQDPLRWLRPVPDGG